MRRHVISCITAITGITGLLLAVGGIGTRLYDKGRVSAIGMILMGVSMLPYQRQIPEWQPAWTQRFAIAYALCFISIGIVIFLLSFL